MASVTLNGVTKKFGDVTAVDDVTLEVQDKEFLVLVGPSGCGKTTILRLIAGLESPSKGDVYIGSRRVNDLPAKDRDLAMVFQSYALYPHMNVFDNMSFALRLRHTPRREMQRRVHEAASLLGIEHLLQRKPRELSGGERQRVALGRAIVREPQVFLMDEPLSNLDAKLRVQTRAELVKLQRRLQTTVIYVTHDQVEAMTMADRIVLVKDGVIQQVNHPQAIYETPANIFVAEFMGSPGMNFFKARLTPHDGEVAIDAGIFKIRLPGRPEEAQEQDVMVGVRPEDIIEVRNPEASGANGYFHSRVDIAEPLGSEKLLHLITRDISFVARVDPRSPAQAGDELTLAINTERVRLFDPRTGNALSITAGETNNRTGEIE